jgi:GTP-binding protein
MMTQRKDLAKTSRKPGKTQTINHFLINDNWYLVDLPGYGYASVSKNLKKGWSTMIEQYLLTRKNLFCLFVLLDARRSPQEIDLSFIQWAGHAAIPICLLLTKADKLSNSALRINKKQIEDKLLESWDELPPIIVTSAEKKTGREEIIALIQTALASQN